MGPFRCNLALFGGLSPRCLGGLETFEGGDRATTVVSFFSPTEGGKEKLHRVRMKIGFRLGVVFVETQVFAGDGEKGRVEIGKTGRLDSLDGGRDGFVT